MRVLICDDNVEFGEEFARYVSNYVISSDFYDDSFKMDIISKSKNVIPFLKTHDVDILFLDISMPEIDGFEIAQYVFDNEYKTHLIFVSNLEDRVFSSFRYRPFRFIRKSNYKKESEEAVKAAVHDISLKNRFITINKHNEVTPIRISRIIYAEKESRANYVTIYCVGDLHRYRCSMSKLESQFADFDFVKPSSSAIVNLEHIIQIKDNTIFLNGGYEYHITSARYRKMIANKFMNFMRNE